MDSDTDFRTFEFTGRHLSRGYIFICYFALNYIVCERQNVRSFLNIYRFAHSSRFYILQQFPKKIEGAVSADGKAWQVCSSSQQSIQTSLALNGLPSVLSTLPGYKNHTHTAEITAQLWNFWSFLSMGWDTFQCLARAVGYRLPGLMITI